MCGTSLSRWTGEVATVPVGEPSGLDHSRRLVKTTLYGW